ncbi:hypothetical protein YPPY58_0874, partial [Yersinia pestis PY-58]
MAIDVNNTQAVFFINHHH